MEKPATPPTPPSRFFLCWQAEAVRLREAHWGPLEDRIACQKALREPADLQARILARAAGLAQHSGLQARLSQWATGARWALVLLWLAAGLAGITAAATALNRPDGAINLALALLALLGLHALTFLIWLVSVLPGVQPGTLLSRLWLWLTQRLARSPDSVLAAQAFLSLLARLRAWKSVLGVMSHGAWTAAFLGMLPTLTILLATRRYTFHWETTLLSPDTFVALTQAISSWPALLGFAPPATLQVAASVGGVPLPADVQASWSWWLVGCVFAWGFVPRLVALLACLAQLRLRLRTPVIDPQLPGWLELRERLLPTHQALGIDQPAPAAIPAQPAGTATGQVQDPPAILGFELGPDLGWPPGDLPDGILDLGRCDSRDDRSRIRTQLAHLPARLLLACDARLTPDRGTGHWLDELQQLCPDLHVLCLEGTPTRLAAWRQLLAAQGIPQALSLQDWLTHIGISRHG